MRVVLMLSFALLVGGCGNSDDGMGSPTSSTAPNDAFAAMAAALPPVEVQCPPSDEPRGVAFDAENGGLPTPEDVLGLAVGDLARLPKGQFRKTAETEDAAQFVFPATGPAQAVVVVTKLDASNWRVHHLEGCTSLTVMPGES